MESKINKTSSNSLAQSKKDTLFKVDSVSEDFEFNDRVVEVFDDMLERSIPFYDQVILATSELLDRLLLDGDKIVDLGCATGTTLLQLSRLLPERSFQYIGVDNSPAMLEKAQLKAELYSKKNTFSFQEKDIMELNVPDTGTFILNYTLQFIRPMQRHEFVKHLFDNLKPGGLLILSEKTISHNRRLNREFIDIYHNFKRERGYSELEIAKKREALENVLIPFSIDENKEMLSKVGFSSVETFFQWFNFTSIIAVKPQ